MSVDQNKPSEATITRIAAEIVGTLPEDTALSFAILERAKLILALNPDKPAASVVSIGSSRKIGPIRLDKSV